MSTLTSPAQIDAMRFLTLRRMLQMEIAGLIRSRAPSAYVLLKRDYGLSGTRAQVFVQATKVRAEILAIQSNKE